MIYYLTSGVILMPKGTQHKKYTPEFKKLVVETMIEEKLGYKETERRFGLPHMRAAAWERIYLEEGPEGPLLIVMMLWGWVLRF